MPQRPAAELVRFSYHRLLPEVQLFFGTGRILTRTRMGLRPELPWILDAAALESFALHSRALIDFFYKPRQHAQYETDAFAADFFDPGEWEKAQPKPGPWIGLVRGAGQLDRVGSEIAHLRYDDAETLTAQASGWPISQLIGAIGGVLATFLEAAPRALLAPGVVEHAWREIPLFARVDRPSAAPSWPTPAQRARRRLGPLTGAH